MRHGLSLRCRLPLVKNARTLLFWLPRCAEQSASNLAYDKSVVLPNMNREIKGIHSHFRRIGSWAGLLALLLIYAPMASAALMAATGVCCTGNQCPIHGNHHPGQESPKQTSERSPMDCGHEGHESSQMQACSMSCCQNVEQAAVHAPIFLLTPVSVLVALASLSRLSPAASATEISSAFAPLAPPPKLLIS
jgi:hypothetical protein